MVIFETYISLKTLFLMQKRLQTITILKKKHVLKMSFSKQICLKLKASYNRLKYILHAKIN